MVITEFIATRHYLEGLALSLGALILAVRYPYSSRGRNLAGLMGIALLFYLSALAKEVYVTFTFYCLVGLFFHRRQWLPLLVMFASGFAYAAHRLWFLNGISRDSFPIHVGLLKNFQSLPFTLTGNNGGYALTAVIGLFMILAVLKKELRGFRLLWLIGAFGVLLGSILPVYLHLHVGHESPGTWYRLVFLWNTVLVILGAWLAQRLLTRKHFGIFSLLLAVTLASASLKAATWWDHLKGEYQVEARFYLDHPTRLLYTELPAAWFIGNVQDLYGGDAMPHYIDREGLLDRGVIQRLLEDHGEIWRRTPQGYKPDPELYNLLIEKNKAMQRPFTPPLKTGL